jgi:hypothetical protein
MGEIAISKIKCSEIVMLSEAKHLYNTEILHFVQNDNLTLLSPKHSLPSNVLLIPTI